MVNKTFRDAAIVTGNPDFWQRPADARTVVADDETLPFDDGHARLWCTRMCLHWANDPVGQLIQSRRALRPDGLFLASSWAARPCTSCARHWRRPNRTSGGLSPRVAPMGEIRDLGALLQRAGFALPVADSIR